MYRRRSKSNEEDFRRWKEIFEEIENENLTQDGKQEVEIRNKYRTICSQVQNNALYGRNPPSFANLPKLRTEEHEEHELHDTIDLHPQEGDDNVQKLVAQEKYYSNEIQTKDDEKNLGPDGPPQSGKKKKEKIVSQNVNRVQEMTGQLWPIGVVPYFVNKEVYDPTTVNRIVKAMGAIEAVSCVIFKELDKKPKDNPDGWLHFTNPRKERECVHEFSSIDSEIELVLGFDCLHPDEILHALLHALGFRDEVTHPHRDQYIRVLWNNIQPKYRSLFRIRHEDASYKLVEYDPMSIMHFHDRAFSDNGAATIAAVIPGLQITSPKTLSQLDIMRLKLAFSHECNKRNIGDLLITCKNSLSSQKLTKKKQFEEDDVVDNSQNINENVNEEDAEQTEIGQIESNKSLHNDVVAGENVQEDTEIVQNVDESTEGAKNLNEDTEAVQTANEETKTDDSHNIDNNEDSSLPQIITFQEKLANEYLDEDNLPQVETLHEKLTKEHLQDKNFQFSTKGAENVDDDYKRIPNKFKSMYGP